MADHSSKENPQIDDKKSSPSPLSFRERVNVWLPLLLAVMLGVGTWIGLQMRTQATSNYIVVSDSEYKNKHASSVGKVEEILRFVDARYLEKVKRDRLEDAAIRGLLKELDPHSTYIPPTRIQDVKESLKGDFEGIGVEFYMLDDTIMVVGVVPNGPSDQAGVEVGDKFILINDSLVAGVGLNSDDVVDRLKGESNSAVKIQVLRRGSKNLRKITIERGTIPMKSVETAYMLDDKTGYIKVTRFSGTTNTEYLKAINRMINEEGMEDLIIDLRHNPGGYLMQATEMLSELFANKRLLVYTEGRSYKRKEYKSKGNTLFKIGKVAVLIDEGSASASEIMAGAIQDNDRGIIVGRRSFGKGLVQEQYDLSDESALRLTVAKYYTPSGRLIQRSYENGVEDYAEDMERRYESGELFYRDSIKIADSTEYKTTGGRTVYGGGGIIPDVFVPLDTITRNSYYLSMNPYTVSFVYRYLDHHYKEFERYTTIEKFVREYQPSAAVLAQFWDYVVEERGVVARNEAAWKAAQPRIRLFIKAYIAQQLFRDEGFSKVMLTKDQDVKAALEELKRNSKRLPEAKVNQ